MVLMYRNAGRLVKMNVGVLGHLIDYRDRQVALQKRKRSKRIGEVGMVSWTDYKQHARERGSLALELYVVISTLVKPPESVKAALPEHLAYQAEQEAAGTLALAGPLSDFSGKEMVGEGLIVYRAESLSAATKIAANDPMHLAQIRKFTIRRWLLNEGYMKPEAD